VPASAAAAGQVAVFDAKHICVAVSQHCDAPATGGQLDSQSVSTLHFGTQAVGVDGDDDVALPPVGGVVLDVGAGSTDEVSLAGGELLEEQAATSTTRKRAGTDFIDFMQAPRFGSGQRKIPASDPPRAPPRDHS
jgi:hypothetical protein